MGHFRINSETGPVSAENPFPVGGSVDIGSIAVPSTFPFMGQKAVTTAGTRVALVASSTPLEDGWIVVTAWATNTGIIYVKDVTVTSANGFRLGPGMSLQIRWDELATVYIDASVSGEGASYAGW